MQTNKLHLTNLAEIKKAAVKAVFFINLFGQTKTEYRRPNLTVWLHCCYPNRSYSSVPKIHRRHRPSASNPLRRVRQA